MRLFQKTCLECGETFEGGSAAKYCLACRYVRQLQAAARCRKLGSMRKIGSVDKCQICGAEYTVKSPNAMYCKKCRDLGVKADDEFYQKRDESKTERQKEVEALYDKKQKEWAEKPPKCRGNWTEKQKSILNIMEKYGADSKYLEDRLGINNATVWWWQVGRGYPQEYTVDLIEYYLSKSSEILVEAPTIAEMIEIYGKSREEFAEFVGIDKAKVDRWIYQHKNPPKYILKLIYFKLRREMENENGN